MLENWHFNISCLIRLCWLKKTQNHWHPWSVMHIIFIETSNFIVICDSLMGSLAFSLPRSNRWFSLLSAIQFSWFLFGEFAIGSTYNPLNYIFLYSCHFSAWYGIDILRWNSIWSLLVTDGFLETRTMNKNCTSNLWDIKASWQFWPTTSKSSYKRFWKLAVVLDFTTDIGKPLQQSSKSLKT